MKKPYIFPLIIIILLVVSCSKKSAGKDNHAPEITLTSPTNNQVFTGAQTIIIQGTVTDNQYINQVHIEITDLLTGAEYNHVHIHPQSKTYAYHQSFAIKAGASYKIRVIAEDPSLNVSSRQADITCH